MFLNKKYKIGVVFLLILLMQACSFGAKKNIKSNHIETIKSVNLQDSSNEKLLVIEDDSLKQISSNIEKTKGSLISNAIINNKLPIFILTGKINSFTSIYGQCLCDLINNDFTNNKYIAITQPLENPQEAINYLRKDDLTTNANIPFVADFLITRTDYLFEKMRNNTGPLKDQPTLDVVMFLNGNYLFLWGNKKYGAIEFVDFVNKFNANNPNLPLVIAVTNNFAKDLLTKVILANNFSAEIKLVSLSDVNNLKENNLKNYDLIAYAGPIIHNEIINTLRNYGQQFLPITLSEEIMLNTQIANPEITSSDITSYYNKSDLISIAMLIGENNLKIQGEKSDSLDSVDVDIKDLEGYNEPKCNSEEGTVPFINNNKFPQDYDEKVFGKSKFNFNIKPIAEILEIKGKLINIDNIKISSIGIRNVLLATRNTDVNKVFDLVSAFFSKYNLVKSTYVTPDMKYFTAKDLITGNLYKNNLKYHYGILNYSTYAKNNNYSLIGNKEEVPLIISSYLSQINYPAFYGLEIPGSKEENIINNSYKGNIIYKRQEEVLKNLQILVDSLKKDLNVKLNNKDIIDSQVDEFSKKDSNKELNNVNTSIDLNITDNSFDDDYLPFNSN